MATKQDPQELDKSHLEFIKNLPKIISNYKINNENEQNLEDARKMALLIVQKLTSAKNVTFDQAYIGMSALYQIGSYLKGVSNRKITVSGVEFTKKDILYASDSVGNKYTQRVIAKSIRDDIVEVSKLLKIQGNLFAQFKQENSIKVYDLDNKEDLEIAVYCTDIQLDNPNTPKEVREFLASRAKNRSNTNR